MAGNGYNHKITRNRKIYEAYLASLEAARLLDERPKTYKQLAKLFCSPGQPPLTRARIGQIIADERRRAGLPPAPPTASV